MKRCLVPLLAVILVSGCRSTSSDRYQKTSRRISKDLLKQVEKRRDPRYVRVLVTEFEAAPQGNTAFYYPPGASPRQISRRLKHELMVEMAKKLTVIDDEYYVVSDADPCGDGADSEPMSHAKKMGANLVLVGSFSITKKNDVTILARLVETDTSNVIATSQRTVKKASPAVRY